LLFERTKLFIETRSALDFLISNDNIIDLFENITGFTCLWKDYKNVSSTNKKVFVIMDNTMKPIIDATVSYYDVLNVNIILGLDIKNIENTKKIISSIQDIKRVLWMTSKNYKYYHSHN